MKCKIVRIDFLDHSHSNGEEMGLIKCTVFGAVVAENKHTICVASWIANASIDHNSEVFNIAKSAIIKIKTLKIESL